MNGQAFSSCSALESVSLPKIKDMSTREFYKCTNLKQIDIWKKTTIPTQAFYNSSVLDVLILRGTLISSLSNTSAFDGTPFASGGTGGVVYVPSALIEQYQQATNWSTLYAAGTCTFLPIEGSEYE